MRQTAAWLAALVLWLYRGSQLIEAQAWIERNFPSQDEVAFLCASVAEREREETEKHAQQARELALQQQVTRRQRYVIGMIGMTSVVVIVGLILILLQQQQAQLLSAQNNLIRTLPVSVTNLNNAGPGSLRQAIADAEDGSAITFAKNLKSGTITLTSGKEIAITKNLTISGTNASPLSISGGNNGRVFSVSQNVTVTISNLTIKAGYVGEEIPLSTGSSGGGIENDGTLVLLNSTISGNRATGGGGIFNGGSLTLIKSTVSGNTAVVDASNGSSFNQSTLPLTGKAEFSPRSGDGENTIFGGGGIYNKGSLTLINSTISGNRTDRDGGGINNTGSLSLLYCTIYNNTAKIGGGIAVESRTPRLEASIVANDHADISPDISGKVELYSTNLIQNISGANILYFIVKLSDILHSNINININTFTKHPIIGQIPKVGPLQNNGGPTETHALLLGSPAIGADPLCDVNTDQRTIDRPQGAGCDIGAYELVDSPT